MDDHYTILGVSKTATADEIKSAYRKLASKHHPDKGGDTATFQKIQSAYDTLSNPDSRAAFDNPQSHNFHFENGVPTGFEDLFRHFGGDPFRFGQTHQPKRNRVLNIQTTITLEDAYIGKELSANLQMPSGKDHTFTAKIPAGVMHGTVLRLKEIGDDTIPDIPRGDIHLTVYIVPHAKFDRNGDDLMTTLNVSAFDAILGTEIEVDTINNISLKVTVPPATQPNTILGAQGYGMPNLNDNRYKGRLLLRINVIIPMLTDEQKVLIQQAKELK